MSNVARIAAQAANTLETPPNVENVFSTYLYDGNDATRSITNGIDLSGEGGMVWFKSRTTTTFHGLFDTERGATKRLRSDSTNAEDTLASDLTAFNSDGFTLGNGGTTNTSPRKYASWTFRKAPKFFDVVEFTYTGSAQISHNLGGKVGAIIMKRTDAAQDWLGWFYRGSAAGSGYYLSLNTTNSNAGARVDTEHSDTYFNPAYVRGSNSGGTVNAVSGGTYVAYLFAHNDGDGTFGPDGDQDIIKCGSYTGNSSINEIDLGFEAQWVLIKNTTNAQSWMLYDAMRGMVSLVGTSSDAQLSPNTSAAEVLTDTIAASANGFTLENSSLNTNRSANTYIYIAIRRGPMAVPEDADDVFDVSEVNAAFTTKVNVGFPVDAQIATATSQTSNRQVVDRMRGVRTNATYASSVLFANLTSAEQADSNSALWWDQTGFHIPNEWANINTVFYNWKRAPNFFDVVAYSGNSTAGRTVSHNLGVAPEMMWIKSRNVANTHWTVYHSGMGNDKIAYLSSDSAAQTVTTAWNSTTPSSTDFTLGTLTVVNQSGYDFVAYLFASLDGVSKVGSYTGTGTSQTIDCGFSAGARFVLIKNTTTTSTKWLLFDSVRGITSGDDPYLLLNEVDAENTTSVIDIEPQNAGFEVNGTYDWLNKSGDTYIFYAIA